MYTNNASILLVEFDLEVEPLKIEDTDDMDGEYQSPNDKPKSPNDNDESADDGVCQIDQTRKPRKKRKTWLSKSKNKEYQKLFSENKHLLDMSCDECASVFETLEEARTHYSREHKNNPKGYLKCCGKRLFHRCHVVEHITRHLDPDKFKCAFHDHSI